MQRAQVPNKKINKQLNLKLKCKQTDEILYSTLSKFNSESSISSSSSVAFSVGGMGLPHEKWVDRKASSDSRSRTKMACSPYPCFSLDGAKSKSKVEKLDYQKKILPLSGFEPVTSRLLV